MLMRWMRVDIPVAELTPSTRLTRFLGLLDIGGQAEPSVPLGKNYLSNNAEDSCSSDCAPQDIGRRTNNSIHRRS